MLAYNCRFIVVFLMLPSCFFIILTERITMNMLKKKKVVQILETSIDELVSGEGLKKKIENEQVVARPVPNLLQTLLYGMVAVVYGIIFCNAIPDYILMFDEKYNHLPAYQFGSSEIAFLIKNIAMLVLAVSGMVLSMKNKLNSRIVGWIMSAPYILVAIDLYFAWSTRLIHSLARIGMIVLMAYQAYVWEKKKKMIKIS